MKLNCSNCYEVLSKYLEDMPLEWREQIVYALCKGLEDRDITCTDIKPCETLTYLSAFTRSDDKVSFTFIDEKGQSTTSSFDVNELHNSSLNDVLPRCITSVEEWQGMTYDQRIQAIINYDCNCCTTTTTSTTTLPPTPAPQRNTYIFNNYTHYDDVFAYDFGEEGGIQYLGGQNGQGQSSAFDYVGTNNESCTSIQNPNERTINVTITVDEEPFVTNVPYDTNVNICDIKKRSDVVVTITSGQQTSTTTTTTTEAPETTTTSTSSTTTTTTKVRPTTTTSTSSTTTRTTRVPYVEPPCPAITDATILDSSQTTTTTTTRPETDITTTTTTTIPPSLDCPKVVDIVWSVV